MLNDTAPASNNIVLVGTIIRSLGISDKRLSIIIFAFCHKVNSNKPNKRILSTLIIKLCPQISQT